jgi:NADH:ubiquinone oxidoreductase subunit 3 (subunit A)
MSILYVLDDFSTIVLATDLDSRHYEQVARSGALQSFSGIGANAVLPSLSPVPNLTSALLPYLSSQYAQTYFSLVIYIFLAFALCGILAGVAYLLSLSTAQETEKRSEYECGFAPFDSATRLPFDVHFYLVGILFLIFDVEVALLFPWILSLRTVGWFGFYNMMAFLFILSVGFLYEWKRGALLWPTRYSKSQAALAGSLSGFLGNYQEPHHPFVSVVHFFSTWPFMFIAGVLFLRLLGQIYNWVLTAHPVDEKAFMVLLQVLWVLNLVLAFAFSIPLGLALAFTYAVGYWMERNYFFPVMISNFTSSYIRSIPRVLFPHAFKGVDPETKKEVPWTSKALIDELITIFVFYSKFVIWFVLWFGIMAVIGGKARQWQLLNSSRSLLELLTSQDPRVLIGYLDAALELATRKLLLGLVLDPYYYLAAHMSFLSPLTWCAIFLTLFLFFMLFVWFDNYGPVYLFGYTFVRKDETSITILYHLRHFLKEIVVTVLCLVLVYAYVETGTNFYQLFIDIITWPFDLTIRTIKSFIHGIAAGIYFIKATILWVWSFNAYYIYLLPAWVLYSFGSFVESNPTEKRTIPVVVYEWVTAWLVYTVMVPARLLRSICATIYFGFFIGSLHYLALYLERVVTTAGRYYQNYILAPYRNKVLPLLQQHVTPFYQKYVDPFSPADIGAYLIRVAAHAIYLLALLVRTVGHALIFQTASLLVLLARGLFAVARLLLQYTSTVLRFMLRHLLASTRKLLRFMADGLAARIRQLPRYTDKFLHYLKAFASHLFQYTDKFFRYLKAFARQLFQYANKVLRLVTGDLMALTRNMVVRTRHYVGLAFTLIKSGMKRYKRKLDIFVTAAISRPTPVSTPDTAHSLDYPSLLSEARYAAEFQGQMHRITDRGRIALYFLIPLLYLWLVCRLLAKFYDNVLTSAGLFVLIVLCSALLLLLKTYGTVMALIIRARSALTAVVLALCSALLFLLKTHGTMTAFMVRARRALAEFYNNGLPLAVASVVIVLCSPLLFLFETYGTVTAFIVRARPSVVAFHNNVLTPALVSAMLALCSALLFLFETYGTVTAFIVRARRALAEFYTTVSRALIAFSNQIAPFLKSYTAAALQNWFNPIDRPSVEKQTRFDVTPKIKFSYTPRPAGEAARELRTLRSKAYGALYDLAQHAIYQAGVFLGLAVQLAFFLIRWLYTALPSFFSLPYFVGRVAMECARWLSIFFNTICYIFEHIGTKIASIPGKVLRRVVRAIKDAEANAAAEARARRAAKKSRKTKSMVFPLVFHIAQEIAYFPTRIDILLQEYIWSIKEVLPVQKVSGEAIVPVDVNIDTAYDQLEQTSELRCGVLYDINYCITLGAEICLGSIVVLFIIVPLLHKRGYFDRYLNYTLTRETPPGPAVEKPGGLIGYLIQTILNAIAVFSALPDYAEELSALQFNNKLPPQPTSQDEWKWELPPTDAIMPALDNVKELLDKLIVYQETIAPAFKFAVSLQTVLVTLIPLAGLLLIALFLSTFYKLYALRVIPNFPKYRGVKSISLWPIYDFFGYDGPRPTDLHYEHNRQVLKLYDFHADLDALRNDLLHMIMTTNNMNIQNVKGLCLLAVLLTLCLFVFLINVALARAIQEENVARTLSQVGALRSILDKLFTNLLFAIEEWRRPPVVPVREKVYYKPKPHRTGPVPFEELVERAKEDMRGPFFYYP